MIVGQGGITPNGQRERPAVALFGEWNTTNLGDRAIARAATHYFIDRGYDVKLFALGSLRFIAHVSAEDWLDFFEHQEVIRHAPSQARWYVRFLQGVPLAAHAFRVLRNHDRWLSVLDHLESCRIIAVGGGDLLNQRYIHFVSPLQHIAHYARTANVPLVCLGCSSSDRFTGVSGLVLRRFIRMVRVMSVRDKSTQEAVQRICPHPVSLFGDFALPPHKDVRPHHLVHRHRVAVNVMRQEQDHHQYRAFIERVIRALITLRYEVVLFTTGNVQDGAALSEIAASFTGFVRVEHTPTLDTLRDMYRQSGLVIASRLHAAILSLEAGTPAIAVSSGRKIRNYFETIGLGNYCVAPDEEGLITLNAMITSGQYDKEFDDLRLEPVRSGHRLLERQLAPIMEMPGMAAQHLYVR